MRACTIEALKRMDTRRKECRGHKEITLPSGHVALVDAEDYTRAIKYKWYYSATKNKKYVRTGNGLGLHRIVLGIQSMAHVRHLNGDRLDNRKQNLFIVGRENWKRDGRIEGKVPFVCHWCGKAGMRYAAQLKHYSRSFCDAECMIRGLHAFRKPPTLLRKAPVGSNHGGRAKFYTPALLRAFLTWKEDVCARPDCSAPRAKRNNGQPPNRWNLCAKHAKALRSILRTNNKRRQQLLAEHGF